MARKHKHEDHINHEAWAIPYGDLMTLLLAFFVVMYATSSVNEGRYRVLADSLSQAFGGPPKSMQPVQIGDKPQKGSQPGAVFTSPSMRGFEKEASRLQARAAGGEADGGKHADNLKAAAMAGADADARGGLQQMAEQVEAALQDLIREKLVVVRRNSDWLEIEIRTDILFSSGVAQLSPRARPALRKLANVLKPFDQMLRIEGHTDNVPIATSVYPSNWELSAARAASVVHLFMESGVAPARMSVAGFGEYRPVGDNTKPDGRNHNRRVVIVALDDHKPAPQTAEASVPPAMSAADAALTAALDNNQLQATSTESTP
jgi:chemotaxis protein MotB